MRLLKVLVIEDNEDDCFLEERQLRAAKFDVETAPGGEEGLAKTLSWFPDVVLCDVNMTRQNGYWYAEQVKTNKIIRHIPLIAITGHHGMFADELLALEAGFDALLLKQQGRPLDLEKFRELVTRLCRPLSLPPT